MVGNMWCLLVNAAVPREDKVLGYSVTFLSMLLGPLAAAVGKSTRYNMLEANATDSQSCGFFIYKALRSIHHHLNLLNSYF